jgi:Flp pilus assembly protein TadG
VRALAGLRGRAAEEGAELVEFALAVTVFLLLVSGGVDVGFWVFEKTQMANAARDGARVAMLYIADAGPSSFGDTAAAPGTCYETGTTVACNTDQQQIFNAVAIHLPGRSFTVTVNCQQPPGTPLTSCAYDTTVSPPTGVPGLAQVTVSVTATRPDLAFFGPIFPESTVSGQATMTIEGLPGAP